MDPKRFLEVLSTGQVRQVLDVGVLGSIPSGDFPLDLSDFGVLERFCSESRDGGG